MIENVTAKIDPRMVKNLKIAAVVVGATLAVVAVGAVLYKAGAFNGQTAEEIVEAAVQAA